MSAGQLLKGYRIQNSLSQSQLANMLGTTQRQISYWETDTRPIPSSILNQLKKNGFKIKKESKVKQYIDKIEYYLEALKREIKEV